MNRLPTVIVPSLSLSLLLVACQPENVTTDGAVESTQQEIVGGDPERIKDAPWQVSIQDVEFGHVCGGAIIDSWHVVTARHCFEQERRPRELISPSVFKVAAGVSKLSRIEAEGQLIEVADILPVDAGYDGIGTGHDIIVVRLGRPLRFGKKVQPIALATAADERAGRIRPGVIATVTGFGASSIDGPTIDQLQTVAAPIVAQEVALAEYGPLPDDLIAAGGRAGEASCSGDSGGPLTVRKGWGTILAGLVSFGPAEACGIQGVPAMYTRVAAYTELVRQTTRLAERSLARFPGVGGGSNQLQFFPVHVPAGQRFVNFHFSGGTGDANLVVRKDQRPTETEFDCISDISGLTAETCHVFGPAEGTYFVGVIGTNDFAGATVQVTAYPEGRHGAY